MSGVLAGALAVIVIVLPGPQGGTPGADGNPQAPDTGGSAAPWVSPPDVATPRSVAPDAGGGAGTPYAAGPDAGGGSGQPGGLGQALPRLGQAVGGVTNGVGNGLANGVNGVSRAVDLSGWKLTLPKASEKGTAASINPADSAPPWLTRDDGAGCLKFWAPVDGATTPNSEHPRTELVSLNNFKAGSGQHVLRASLAVAQAPSTNQDIIIGQIHGADDISSVPFVMLHYDAGTIKVVVKQAQSGSTSDKYPLISGVPIGARFDYGISDNGDGNLTFAARYGGRTPHVTIPIPAPFRGATVRFQAGAYQQGEAAEGGQADDGARVNFFTLDEGPDGRSAP
ncbi:MAG TPA: polysaccharide lyase family 7 protein [Pseudonocardia sp.]|nr:polysaccharide lyase family 7 protein [Pseudonocardia sp.]